MKITSIATVALVLASHSKKFKCNKLFDIIYIEIIPEKKKSDHIHQMLKFANCDFIGTCAKKEIHRLEDSTQARKQCNKLGYDASELVEEYKFRLYNNQLSVRNKVSHELTILKVATLALPKPVLILENGVDLSCSFVSDIEDAMIELPMNWDILLIHEYYTTINKNCEQVRKVNEVSSVDSCIGFLINGSKSAKKIYDLKRLKKTAYSSLPNFFTEQIQKKTIKIYAMSKHTAASMYYFPAGSYVIDFSRYSTIDDSLAKYMNNFAKNKKNL